MASIIRAFSPRMTSLPPINGRATWLHRLYMDSGPSSTMRALDEFTIQSVAQAVDPNSSPNSLFPTLELDFSGGFADAVVDRVLRRTSSEFNSPLRGLCTPISKAAVHIEVSMFFQTVFTLPCMGTVNKELEPQLRPTIRAAVPGTSVTAPRPSNPGKRPRDAAEGSDDDGAIMLVSLDDEVLVDEPQLRIKGVVDEMIGLDQHELFAPFFIIETVAATTSDAGLQNAMARCIVAAAIKGHAANVASVHGIVTSVHNWYFLRVDADGTVVVSARKRLDFEADGRTPKRACASELLGHEPPEGTLDNIIAWFVRSLLLG